MILALGDLVEVLVAPLWTAVLAVLALALIWRYRRPLGEMARELGIRRVSFLGIDLELIADQAESTYAGKKDLAPPPRSELRAFAILGAQLAPLVAHRRVLWVDDEPGHNVAETRLLRTLGVDVENAETTDEAVDRVRKDPARFDLVISDWTRGGREAGPELAERLHGEGRDLPLVFYVGIDTPERQKRAAEVKAVGLTRVPDRLMKLVLVELSIAR